jgi:hypothetical protein
MRENVSLALDCLSIVLMALGLSLTSRNRSLGLVFGVLGLAGMSGGAALRAFPSPTRANLEKSVISLGEEIEHLTTRLSRSEVHNRKLVDDLADLRAVLALKEDELRQALGKLEKALHEHRMLVAEGSARTRDLMELGVTTRLYAVDRLAERELIAGRVGDYYSVRLLGDDGSQIVFPKGQYLVPAHEAAIRTASRRLASDLFLPLAASDKDVRFFLRGGADAEPMGSQQAPDPAYRSISYRARGEDGRYGAAPLDQLFDGPIRNEDLPILRAAHYRKAIGDALGPKEPEILHKPPAKHLGEQERMVELIVYVER